MTQTTFTLRILTWNISFAYGPGSDGVHVAGMPDYKLRSRAVYEEALTRQSAVIKDLNPDVVLLQEVDFCSTRSHSINQLDYISRATGLYYRDALVSWDSLYVPYPGLNPRNHFKKVNSGGGILSRYPIAKIQHDLLPKPRENSVAYNFFYLHRYLQLVKIAFPKIELTLMNLHLEAFSKDNRELHLIKVQDRLIDYHIDITGGDFNGEIKVSDETLKKGWHVYPAPEPTFKNAVASQVLDGFITGPKMRLKSIKVLQTGVVSDHFPVLLEVECAV